MSKRKKVLIEKSPFRGKKTNSQKESPAPKIKSHLVSRNKELQRLLDSAATAMQKALTPTDVFKTVSGELRKQEAHCALLLLDKKRSHLDVKHFGYDNKKIEIVEEFSGLSRNAFRIPSKRVEEVDIVLEKGKGILVKDQSAFLRRVFPETSLAKIERVVKRLSLTPFILAPFIVEDRIIGIFAFQAMALDESNIPSVVAFANLFAGSWRRSEFIERSCPDTSSQPRKENELNTRNERFREIIQASNTGAWETDAEFLIHFSNDYMAHLLGFEPGEIIGKTVFSFMPTDDLSDQEEQHAKLRKGQMNRYERRLKRRDESIIWVLVSAVPEMNENEELQGSFLLLTDITLLKEAEIKLHKEKETAQRYLDVVKVMIVVLDPEGQVVLINKRGCEILGDSEKNIIGTNWFALFLPERIRTENDELFQRYMSGEMEVIEYHENPVVSSRGEERLIAWHDIMLWDEAGKPTGLIISGEDITEQRKIEFKLRSTQELYRTFIDSQSDMTFLKDEKFRYLLANQAFCDFFRLSPWELTGKTDFELMEAETARQYRRSDEVTLAGGKLHRSELRIGEKLLESRSFPAKMIGGEIGIGGYISDITEKERFERQIFESEKMYRTLVENANVGIAILQDNMMRYANPKIESLSGYSIAELSSLPFIEFIHPEDIELIQVYLSDFPKGQRISEEIEFRIKNKNNTITWIEAKGVIIRWKEQPAILLFFNDITERKKAEGMILERSIYLDQLFANLPMAAMLAQPDGTVIRVNPTTQFTFGFSPKEIIGKHIDELILFPEVREEGEAMTRRASSGETLAFESRRLRKDGSVIDVFIMVFPVIIKGELKANYLIYHDIAARKRIEADLRDSEESLAFAQQLVHLGSWERNLESGKEVWSEEQFRIFGMTPNSRQPTYDLFLSLVHPEDKNKIISAYDALLEKGQSYDLEYRIVCANGGERVLLTKGEIFRDHQGKPIRMSGINLDITQQREYMNTIKETLKEKEMLLKEIHHRVKNNLQIVSGLLQLQSSHINDQRMQEVLKESQSRIWSMSLVHEKLYMSDDLAYIGMDDYIRTLITGLFGTYGTPVGTINLKIHVDKIWLPIDQVIPLALILNELVSNILKHAFPAGRKGDICIELRRFRDQSIPSSTDAFRLTVADNGIGMPPDIDIDNLSTLGLNLVVNLTHQLGGRLSVERDGGTHVFIEFTNDSPLPAQKSSR